MCGLRLGTGISPSSPLFCRLLNKYGVVWPAVFCDYRIALSIQNVGRKLKTSIYCLDRHNDVRQNKNGVIEKMERREASCRVVVVVLFFFDSNHLFLTPLSRHRPRTSRKPKLAFRHELKSLNKQKYQQSASPRCL